MALIYWASMLVAMGVATGAELIRSHQEGGVLVPEAAVVADGDGSCVLEWVD